MSRRCRGFTLIELLVVILIVLLVSAAALSQIIPALTRREVISAATTLQAAILGARDAAIRANAPRGIRLMPDPTLTIPSFATATPGATPPIYAGDLQLAFNRMIQIELAPDYTEGKASIIGDGLPGATYYSPYPLNPTQTYPTGRDVNGNTATGCVLRIEECAYDLVGIPQSKTSWWWNIRVGDRIRLKGAGRYYTVVGPCTIHPQSPLTAGQNPEMFVNDGPPGTLSQLTRPYIVAGVPNTPVSVEFLYLVNGQDDPSVNASLSQTGSLAPALDGMIDDGWNGFDDNYNNFIDDAVPVLATPNNPSYWGEWETETWQGAMQQAVSQSLVSGNWAGTTNMSYSITRRPVPVQGARETALPGSVVIDATTWNLPLQERSRLPIDPFSLMADILVNADGSVVPQTIYSTPVSFNEPFFHFWLSDRTDVHDTGYLWGYNNNGTPIPNCNSKYGFMLPMPRGTTDSTGTVPYYDNCNGQVPTRFLDGNRRLVTLFTKSGLILIDEQVKFFIDNLSTPFFDAQQGVSSGGQ